MGTSALKPLGPRRLNPSIYRYLYVFHISYDGSFQLFRKNKAFDQWDICLSEGRKYFVNREDFAKHLARADNQQNRLSTRVRISPYTC